MMSLVLPILKISVAAVVIAFASWLSAKKPALAGFIVALPLVSLLALVFSYVEHESVEITVTFAKSILVGIPVSLLFFLPFFFADKLGYGFWVSYLMGIILLVMGYFIHQKIMMII
jgi:hypothetical protein